MASTLVVNRGDDASWLVTVTDKDDVAVDITGYTIFFTVKTLTDVETDDSAALISKDITSHTTPASGITTITVTNSDTDITPGKYQYDIQMKDGSDRIYTIKRDYFVVLQDITKRTI